MVILIWQVRRFCLPVRSIAAILPLVMWICLLGGECCATVQLGHLRTVATSDQKFYPGSSLAIGDIGYFAINDEGNVAFLSGAAGHPYLWAERNGQLQYQLSPEAELNDFIFTNSKDVVFEGVAANAPPPFDARIWKWSPVGTTQLAGPIWPIVDSDGIPIAGLLETQVGNIAASAQGRVFFHAYGKAPGSQLSTVEGVWSATDSPSETHQVLVWGQPIAANTPGVLLAGASNISPLRVNAAGTFVTAIETNDASGAEREAVITNRGGDLRVLYRGGDQVPGQPGETFIGGMLNLIDGGPDLNDNGDIAFLAATQREPAHPGDSIQVGNSIFIDRNGILVPVASTSQSILGGSGNRSIYRFYLGGIAINAHGSVAFGAGISPDPQFYDPNGIVVEDSSGQLRSVVVAGDPVPGGPQGARFLLRNYSGFQLNGLGQIAFTGQFVPLGGSANDPMQGAFVYDAMRGLVPISVPGDLIEVQPGDVRQVSLAGIIGHSTGGADGVMKSLNENGQLLFFARFTDGTSGLFVSNLLAVPEPASIDSAIVGILCVLWYRKTRPGELRTQSA